MLARFTTHVQTCQQYTLNVRSGGKQLVLFSRET